MLGPTPAGEPAGGRGRRARRTAPTPRSRKVAINAGSHGGLPGGETLPIVLAAVEAAVRGVVRVGTG